MLVAISYSPDGTLLASAGLNGIVTLWDVRLDTWQAAACQIANRNLTAAEWEQFLTGQPYHETCPGQASPRPAAPATPVSGGMAA